MIEHRVLLGVIADDLTGAMDTGVQFSKRGLDTLVRLACGQLPEADVWVVDTDSRAVSGEEAAARARDAARCLWGRRVYKKIDSTLRGNLGFELLGVLQLLGCEKSVIAPAFPQAGRTTEEGHQLVNGAPLEETDFAHDPRWPMKSSYIPDIVSGQVGEPVGQIGLDIVQEGRDVLGSAIEAAEMRIVAVDAVSVRHLATIARVLADAGPRWLPCGSAGLAEEWLSALEMGTLTGRKRQVGREGSVLAAATSRHEATARQIIRAQTELHLPIVSVEVHHLGDEEARRSERQRLASEVSTHLGSGSDVLLTSSTAPLIPGLGREVAALLAEVIAEILGEHTVAGLFLTGGDLAVATCRQVGTPAIRIEAEVQVGVPVGTMVGGDCPGLPIVTKAGGFGNERAIVDAIRYLHDG